MARTRRAGEASRWPLALAVAGPFAALALCLALLPSRRPRPVDRNPPSAYVVAYPAGGRAPLRVRLDGSGSTDDTGITAFRWDFGDGSRGEGRIVDHVFETAGSFQPRLEVEDAAGHWSSADATVVATAPADARPPVARLAVSTDRGPAPLEVAFDASASTDDRAVARVRWAFDDGETAEGARVTHRFALPGRYAASVEVSDLAGNLATATRLVTVLAGPPSRPPRASFELSPSTVTAPAEVDFDASASTDDRAVVRYDWSFGDGLSAHGRAVRHRYASAGSFIATLVVWDASGQSDEKSRRVLVRAPPVTSERVLFSDALAPGVFDGSWARVELVDSPVHAGRRALLVTPGPYGALRLRFSPERLDAWDRLGFWIRAAAPEAVSARAVWLEAGREVLGPPVSLAGDLLPGAGGALSNVWRRAAVPLALLGAEGRRVTGFVLQAGRTPAPFAVDDVGLVPPDVELPVLSDCALPPPILDHVTRQGSELFDGALPFRAVGANLYFLQQELSRHVQTRENRPLAEAREALSAAQCAGATVIRLDAFNDDSPEAQDITVIQPRPGVYREEGLEGLDLAVAEAKARHLRVILTLTNNWSAFGGLPRYASWAGVAPEDALDDAQVRDWLSDYVRMLARRRNVYTGLTYAEEPAILAIEIANELRCPGCAKGHDATAFTLALAKVVKDAFPSTLVADGGEGFDDSPALYPALAATRVVAGDEGQSFHRIARSPDVDLVSYHLYPESWRLDPGEATAYIDDHEAVAREAGKVAYLGEFGSMDQDRYRASTYERWLDRLFETDGGSLGLVWQVTYPGRPDNDGFALIPGEAPLSMAALARAAQALAAPGLDGLSLADRRRPFAGVAR